MSELLVHASCVTRFGRGILIRGRSGSGKSSLALELIALGWVLVADDYVALHSAVGKVVARAPERLRGLLEVYGLGIRIMPARLQASIAWIVDLDGADIERMPAPDSDFLLEYPIPRLVVPERHMMTAKIVVQALRTDPELR